MKRQLNKIKAAAENLSSRATTKPDKNTDELHDVEEQVDKYKNVLSILNKKISSNVPATQPQDDAAKEKRSRKIHEYILGQVMEDQSKDLPIGLLKEVLENCANLEKTIASEIVNYEINVEKDVREKLNAIIKQHISTIQNQKGIVTKCHREHEAAKQKYQAALRSSENQKDQAKIHQLKEDEEELATKLEKERDIYATHMFELLSEEESIANYIMNYVKFQQLYYKSALKDIEHILDNMNGLLRKNNKKVFNTSLSDHLQATGRKISYVLELCVCCLVEKGLYEEGLLRVGCGTSKLKRMISAIDANFAGPPLPEEYRDVHVIAGVLKKYLRSLPEPLLTSRLYNDFVIAAQKQTDQQRKIAILDIINQLPQDNYNNLKYLTRFLSCLSEKNLKNKMSPQNIAIVMSPNLLWSPIENDQNYLEQVNSTATVNTIVEALIVDWGFFFEGDVDFYVTMTREELFPALPHEKEPLSRALPLDNMSKSMIVTSSSSSSSGNHHNNINNNNINDDSVRYQVKAPISHSRSSSHDTSLILLNDQMKNRSHSNSSLSDHSSPPQETSPKLPVRRKKQAAPTPPDTSSSYKSQFNRDPNNKLQSSQHLKQWNTNNKAATAAATGEDDFQSLQNFDKQPPEQHHDKLKKAGSHDNLLKLKEKIPPPRPQAVSVECQTLNRMYSKSNNHQKSSALICDNVNSSVSSNKIAFPLPVKPVALPRTTVLPRKSTDDEDSSVVVRSKPAIPERPASIRPPSFKGSVPEMNKVSEGTNTIISSVTTPLKKTQSFRSESLPFASSGGSAMKNAETSFGTTVLERTQMYNIEKQQVAIIDVDLSSHEHDELTASTGSLNDILMHVPQSPRGFDQKIKRPQVPAPPPPTNRPKSSDSTDL